MWTTCWKSVVLSWTSCEQLFVHVFANTQKLVFRRDFGDKKYAQVTRFLTYILYYKYSKKAIVECNFVRI